MSSEDSPTSEQLFERLYCELHAIAARQLQRLPPGQTLYPTEVIHEAFAKMSGKSEWESDSHFLNTAARAMRQLLVDRARIRKAKKRGGGAAKLDFNELDERIVVNKTDDQLLALHDALDGLAAIDERASKLVELTYFLGMQQVEAAEIVGINERTARRDLVFAQAWLAKQLTEE